MLFTFTRSAWVSAFLVLCCSLTAQTLPELFIINEQAEKYPEVVESATYYTLQSEALANWMQAKPTGGDFVIQTGNGKKLVLELSPNSFLAPDFKVTASDGKVYRDLEGLYYKGKVKGEPGSSVALSVFRNQVIGLINVDGDAWVLGALSDAKGAPTMNYTLFATKKLKVANPINCFTDELEQEVAESQLPGSMSASEKNVGFPVDVYFVADQYTFNQKGSVLNVFNYVTGIFNQVAILYDSIEVTAQISEIFVYVTPDPYASLNTTGAVLNAFGANLNGNYNGDLAHFVSTRGLGGGVAWLSGLCSSNYSYAVSASLGDISSFPTYSWATNVVAHEMGHNLSSPHTHDCSWGPTGNQKIDYCGDLAGYSSGTCEVIDSTLVSGTIMSYCHLTGYGVDFTKHFGPLPGLKIKNYVLSSSCLSVQPISCSGAVVLSCGAPHSGTTVGAADSISQYGCNPIALNGNERKHVFTITEPKKVMLTLSNANVKLELVLLGNCSTSNCLAFDEDTIFVPYLEAGTYYVIVDGRNNFSGAYTLNLSCSLPDYCPTAGSSIEEHIESVTIDSYTNNSGNNGGYLLVSAPVFTFLPSQTVNFSITPGYSGTIYNEYFSIWIDYNASNTFESNEQVFLSGNTNTTVTGSFTIPSGLPNVSNVLMRIKMIYGSGNPSPCGNYSYGETEDYLVNIGTPCPAPTNVGYMASAAGNGHFYWDGPSSALKYHLRFRASTASNWINAYPTTRFFARNNLSSTTTYQYQVRTICAVGDSSAWSPLLTFIPAGQTACATPSSSKVIVENPTTARFIWPFMATATKYQIRYRPIGTTTFVTKSTNIAYFRANTLVPGTNYQYQIRSFCNGAWTTYGAFQTFATPALLPSGLEAASVNSVALTIFPNPASESFQLLGVGELGTPKVEVFTVEGKSVAAFDAYDGTPIDVKDWQHGLYFVRVQAADGTTKTITFLKK